MIATYPASPLNVTRYSAINKARVTQINRFFIVSHSQIGCNLYKIKLHLTLCLLYYNKSHNGADYVLYTGSDIVTCLNSIKKK